MNLEINERTLGMLLICAERYALGRRTYIVDDVCSAIKYHMKDIDKRDLYVLINDIENPFCSDYGDDCDKEQWLDLLKMLKKRGKLMNTYLAIITTVLVLTQIIRLIQNTIQLYRQEHELKKHIGWIKDNEISREDFEVQRKAYKLIVEKLEERGE